MYFASRMQAGRMLASQLVKKYRYENCAVLALNDGGVVVGAQIAMQLHCTMELLLSEEASLPQELEAIGSLGDDGSFTFNHEYADVEIEELVGEYYGYVEQEKLARLHDLHRLAAEGQLTKFEFLQGRTIILVSDGLQNGFTVDIALRFLRPVAYEKILVATPVAGVKAVDRMHVLADEIYCLGVVETYISTDHYYNQNDVPDHETVLKTVEDIVLHWQ